MKFKLRCLAAVLLGLLFGSLPACSHIPGLRGLAAPSPFDTISYVVIGAQAGNVNITYTTPVGIVQTVQNTSPPWLSGPVAGYGEFHTQHATISVTGIGCFTVQVFVNADVVAEKQGCGTGFPTTITASK